MSLEEVVLAAKASVNAARMTSVCVFGRLSLPSSLHAKPKKDRALSTR